MDHLPRPDIVIFDMDGTTVRHKRRWLIDLMESLDNLTFLLSAFLKPWQHLREIADKDLEKKKKRKSPSLLAHQIIHKLRRKPIEMLVEPCPGVRDLLHALYEKNIALAVVSNGLGDGYGHDILKTFDLERYFSAFVFKEDIKKSKPHPEPLLLALKRLDKPLKAQTVVWYIGDRRKDIMAAQAANERSEAQIIPLGYGRSLKKYMEKSDENGVFYFECFKDLKQGLT